MTVSEILERRLAVSDAPRGLGPAVSAAAHVTFLVLLVLISRPQRIAVLPISLPVRVVSPSSLPGRPARAVAPPAPVPVAPPAPAPAPAEKKKPVIEKLNQPEKTVPSKNAMPEPTTKRKKWIEPTPVPAGGAPPVELPAAGNGGAEGTAGPLSFGTSVASLDVDFPFAFYVDQMLQLIGANWLKPDVPDGTATIVGFRIQRDGRISDVKIISASGLGVYDRAAVRAIYAANPLPPLPPEFRGENLGIHLRFH